MIGYRYGKDLLYSEIHVLKLPRHVYTGSFKPLSRQKDEVIRLFSGIILAMLFLTWCLQNRTVCGGKALITEKTQIHSLITAEYLDGF